MYVVFVIAHLVPADSIIFTVVGRYQMYVVFVVTHLVQANSIISTVVSWYQMCDHRYYVYLVPANHSKYDGSAGTKYVTTDILYIHLVPVDHSKYDDISRYRMCDRTYCTYI
jgi:hypothetical protein